MTFLEQNPLLIEAINSSSLLSDGQQQILKILVQFDVGIPISQIMALTNNQTIKQPNSQTIKQSKQTTQNMTKRNITNHKRTKQNRNKQTHI